MPHPPAPFTVDPARCTGCGRCVAACTERLFSLEPSGNRKNAVMTTPERCNRCLRCLAECPVGAITERRQGGRRRLNLGSKRQ